VSPRRGRVHRAGSARRGPRAMLFAARVGTRVTCRRVRSSPRYPFPRCAYSMGSPPILVEMSSGGGDIERLPPPVECRATPGRHRRAGWRVPRHGTLMENHAILASGSWGNRRLPCNLARPRKRHRSRRRCRVRLWGRVATRIWQRTSWLLFTDSTRCDSSRDRASRAACRVTRTLSERLDGADLLVQRCRHRVSLVLLAARPSIYFRPQRDDVQLRPWPSNTIPESHVGFIDQGGVAPIPPGRSCCRPELRLWKWRGVADCHARRVAPVTPPRACQE